MSAEKAWEELTEYSLEDVKKHNKANDNWMVIHGKVYDVSAFGDDHPGGPEVLTAKAGRDTTDDFEEVFHSESARNQLKDYVVGRLQGFEGPHDAVFSLNKASKSSSPGGSNMMVYVIAFIALMAAVYFTMFA